jgi:hypothetical protein
MVTSNSSSAFLVSTKPIVTGRRIKADRQCCAFYRSTIRPKHKLSGNGEDFLLTTRVFAMTEIEKGFCYSSDRVGIESGDGRTDNSLSKIKTELRRFWPCPVPQIVGLSFACG